MLKYYFEMTSKAIKYRVEWMLWNDEDSSEVLAQQYSPKYLSMQQNILIGVELEISSHLIHGICIYESLH